MDTDRLVYRSYLLRLWRQRDKPFAPWYASLEDPVTGVRKGFSSIDELLAYFRQQFIGDGILPPGERDDVSGP